MTPQGNLNALMYPASSNAGRGKPKGRLDGLEGGQRGRGEWPMRQWGQRKAGAGRWDEESSGGRGERAAKELQGHPSLGPSI